MPLGVVIEGVDEGVDLGGGGGSGGGLTDDELRATPVDVASADGALEVTLQLVFDRLGDLLTAINAIKIDSDSIAIDADTINLATDGLEGLMQAVRDRMPAALDADGGSKVHVQNTVPVSDGGSSLTVDGPITDAQLRATAVPVADGGGSLTVDGPLTDAQLRSAVVPVDTELTTADLDTGGGTDTRAVVGLALAGSGGAQLAPGDSANGVDVDVTRLPTAATPTQSSVASSATNVTILAANSARKGATVYNDSTAILYLRLGATASTSNHTIQLAAGAYYEVPFGYSGIIDGLWASANGNARVTELT